MNDVSFHSPSRIIIFSLLCLGLLSVGILSSCQSDSRIGTYPANPEAGDSSTISGNAFPSPKANDNQKDIRACNDCAAQAISERDGTSDTVKEAAVGGAGGAGLGAAGSDPGGGPGKGAAFGTGVGVLAGTLYGINENRTQDRMY